ncbi:MAG: arylesterase [Opitutus sp.]
MPNGLIAPPTVMLKFSSVLTVLLLCFAAIGRANALPDKSKTIVFFGDSLTAGYGLDEPLSQAYPARIQEKIDAAHLPYKTVNAGLSGETTAGGLRRVDWILRQPVDIFVLALGGNDGLRGIEPSVSTANLQAIIDRVRAKNPNVKIILGGMIMPPSMGEAYVRDFAAMYPQLAKMNKTGFVPFLLQDVGGRADLNQPDQIHPTAGGQRIVAENVWKVLLPLLSSG